MFFYYDFIKSECDDSQLFSQLNSQLNNQLNNQFIVVQNFFSFVSFFIFIVLNIFFNLMLMRQYVYALHAQMT